MTIKAENTIDFEDIRQLNKSGLSSVKIMLGIFIAAMVVLLVISLCTGNSGRNLKISIAGIIWCVFVYVYMFIVNPRLTYKNFKKKFGNARVKYTLNEKSMGISIENSDGFFDIRKNYRDIFKFTETEKYFFIHIKRNEAYILKKNGISQGTAEDIRSIVSREMGNRFVNRVKG